MHQEFDFPSDIFQMLLKCTPDLYLIINLDFKIIALTSAYAKAMHKSETALLNKNIVSTYSDSPSDTQNILSASLVASLKRVIRRRSPDRMEIQRYDISSAPQNEGKEVRFWSPVNIPIKGNNDEVMFIIHRLEDVTEFIGTLGNSEKYKLDENELFQRANELLELNKSFLESDQRLRLFIDSSKDYAFLILDTDGFIQTWNRGAERIKGYKADEIIGKHFSIFYPEEAINRNHPETELKLARQNGRYEEEAWRIRKDGTQFWANIIITPLYDNKGILIGYGKVTRDLTERRNAEQLKKEFVSVVSHELRTPLTSIKGALGLVLGGIAGECPAKVMHLLGIANSNCERLSRLINDILDIEKIEAGKMEFKYQFSNLTKLINETVNVNQMYANKFGIKLTIGVLPNVWLNVDNDRFMQVLTNLISNAVKFSEKGKEVIISAVEDNDRVRISVTDEGMGMSKEFQKKIFQKFTQADSSTSRSESGTGLGLAISKAIVERLGGTIQFETRENVGTTFYFDLPIFKEHQDHHQEGADYFGKSKGNILICEDDIEQNNYLRVLMENAGFTVESCYTGNEAKKLLAEKSYYALLLDLILPDMVGVDIIKDIGTVSHNKKIPIIIVSVVAKETMNLIQGGAAQVIEWLEKPIDFNKLAKAFSTIQIKIQNTLPKLLHVEDDVDIQIVINNLLQDRASISTASTLSEAKAVLEIDHFDLAILDLTLPDGNGVDLIPLLSEQHIPIIVFSTNTLEAQFAKQVHSIFIKSITSPEKLLETILHFLNNTSEAL